MRNKTAHKATPQHISSTAMPRFQSWARADVNRWQAALRWAKNPERPRRDALIGIYDQVLQDAHLSAQIQRRKLALLGAEYHLIDPQGTYSQNTSEITTPWFDQLLGFYFEASLYGYSLIEIATLDTNGKIIDIKLVDRAHIVPDKGWFIPDLSSDKHIDYRQDDTYSKWLWEVNHADTLGTLNKIVPFALFKRFAGSAWSEYADRFGMPLRVAKTNATDQQSLDRLEEMMIKMASNSYAVIDQLETIEFQQAKDGKGEVYQNLIAFCNAEISKLITGAVVGENTKNGSRAKEQVGENILETLVASDKKALAAFVNKDVIPRLIQMGYPLNGLTFEFIEKKNLQPLWDRTQQAMIHYDFDIEWLNKTFGLEITGKKGDTPTKKTAQNETPKKNNKTPEKGFFV